MTKQYIKDNVTYGFSPSFRKWLFQAPSVNIIQECKGTEKAHKVASIINGAVLRTKGGMDGMARTQITRVVYSN